MRIYSIIYNEKRNAGPKAPKDIIDIVKKEYNAKEITLIRKGIYKIILPLKLLFSKFSNEINIIQYPFVTNNKIYDFFDLDKSILIIHDIKGLRWKNEKLLKKEINIFKKFKYIVVHNNRMKKFLSENGIIEENMYVLQLFDYLIDDKKQKVNQNIIKSKVKVVYSGNLSKEKSPFIYQIDPKKINLELNLYGLGIENDIASNILYKGSFEPENVNEIQGNVGLVWDGNLDESDVDSYFKNYLKYNNPHKLSCYMATGIPVIAWSKSAISDFIKKNNIGYLINNIYDINNIDFSDFTEKLKNVKLIRNDVLNGYYTKSVLNNIISRMDKDEKK